MNDVNSAEKDQIYKQILNSLERAYPGKMLLAIGDTAKATGLSVKTIYNGTSKRTKKKFPIKPVRYGNKVQFRIHDVARYLAEL